MRWHEVINRKKESGYACQNCGRQKESCPAIHPFTHKKSVRDGKPGDNRSQADCDMYECKHNKAGGHVFILMLEIGHSSPLKECEQFCVNFIFKRRTHPVRRARVDFQNG